MNRSTLAHYRILRRLGAGGMGEVHLAEDLQLGRKVALKLLPDTTIPDESSRKRLLREARAAARLDHPNVATIYEVAQSDGEWFIAMQYVNGETLAQHIQSSPLSAEAILSISTDVLSALGAAHERQIVHRDIKPQNIMITPQGRAVILDFGLARVGEASTSDSMMTDMPLTSPGMVSGTLSYMSPEQLRGEPLDGRSDLFSFGVVLFEMITGRRPFTGDSAPTVMASILFAAPVLSEAEIGSPFAAVAIRSLQKNATDRYQTASEMLEALRAAGRGEPVPDVVPPFSVSTTAETAQRPRFDGAPPVHPLARELYLKGRAQWNKRTSQGFQAAIDLFNEALEHDPSFALPYDGLADCYNYLAFYEAIAASDVMDKSRAAAEKAIELAPDLAEPHASLGYIEFSFSWNWSAGEREYLRAMELNPRLATAPHWYSILLSTAGRFEEGLAEAEKAFHLDPLNPIISTARGLPFHFSRQFEQAIVSFRKVEATDSRFPPAHFYLGLALEQLGEYDEAIAALERACTLSPESTLFMAALGHCLGVSGRRDRAAAMLSDLQQRARRRYVSPHGMALIHLGLGEIDSAFARLEEAFGERSPRLCQIACDGRFDRILEDPRYAVIVDTYQLPFPMLPASLRVESDKTSVRQSLQPAGSTGR